MPASATTKEPAPAASGASVRFGGNEKCLMDGSGRLKLSTTYLEALQKLHAEQVVLFYLMPETAVAVYPLPVWEQRSAAILAAASNGPENAVTRSIERQYGALYAEVEVTAQGRITVPPSFREFAGLDLNSQVVVAGAISRLELWCPDRWRNELSALLKHSQEQAAHDRNAALRGNATPCSAATTPGSVSSAPSP